MSEFLVDLWEIVKCTRCGAEPGMLCTTRSGVPTTRSHSCRIVFMGPDQ